MVIYKRWLHAVVLAIVVQAPLVVSARADTVTVDAAILQQLQDVIQQQQEQLQKQSEQLKSQSEVLDSLQQQVNDLSRTASEAQSQASEAKTTAQQAIDTAEKAETVAQADKKVVTSGQERIKVAISGQINRMMNVADDGDETKVYHVDNDNSSSRIRFVGTGQVSEDFIIGTNLEVELQSNDSSNISQINESEGSVSFKDRRAEVFFKSEALGMISIGQGWTASDSTSEVDLSGASVISYSSVADLAGGLFFFDNDADALTDTQVKNVFSNLDGLGRKDRLRYDTPEFYGFMASASTIEDQQYDVALRWGAEVAGFQAGAAVAYSKPDDSDYRINGSASAIHLDTGLNLTFAAGMDDPDEEDRDDATFWYVKGGWLADQFDFGKTALVVDYTETTDISTDGDDGQSYGFFVVQYLEDYGTEFFGGVRVYDLDSSDLDTDEIIVGNIGTRVKF
jgi:hypothetical protein